MSAVEPRAKAPIPWLSYPILLRPRRVERGLARVRAAALVERTPNVWQVSLGVLRMWHRVLFRPETVGMCTSAPVRDSWRARLLSYRPLRFPFLLRERAVAPLDFSGLISSSDRVVRHLLGAYHDAQQFAYDFELLKVHAGELERVVARAREVVERDDEHSRWLRDLVVFEGYHERLLQAAEAALAGDYRLPDSEARNPDISFLAYLNWCAAQPETPAASLKALVAGRGSASPAIKGVAA